MEDIGKRYIIDSSVIVAWLLPVETYKSFAESILQFYRIKKIQLISSTLLPFEIVNSLKSAVLRKRVTKEEAYQALTLYTSLNIQLISPNEREIFDASLHENISAYDSAYVCLMSSTSSPLITGDRKLYNLLKEKYDVIWIEEFS